jgi:hypothetical protein
LNEVYRPEHDGTLLEADEPRDNKKSEMARVRSG